MTQALPDRWHDAVVYQVYIRSFADGDGDGEGDIAGLRDRLPYLRELGVDAIWINPWYPSAGGDGGYDVSDYRDIDPRYGDLAQAKELIADAHALGLKVILDIVPNHSSWEHAWFKAALAAGPGSPERARYIFRDGSGPNGEAPPNNWQSIFGGPAWDRVTEPDGQPGQWYLHLFDRSQPDLEWSSSDVRAEFRDILRFWFDLGADGFRIDTAQAIVKDPALPDLPADGDAARNLTLENHPYQDRDGAHDVYREWRAIGDSYQPPRLFVAEVTDARSVALYVGQDELHTAFNFEYLRSAWAANAMRAVIDDSFDACRPSGSPVTWVLENHDVERVATRYGRDDTRGGIGHHRTPSSRPPDEALGNRRARAAALLTLALPGHVYIYQGQELGLPEVLDLPEDALQDPVWERSGHTERGRDGCRVPLPWTVDGPSHGFGAGDSWLPQPPDWGKHAAEVQEADPGSMLSLYRAALRLRRQVNLQDHSRSLRWVATDVPDVLMFTRAPDFACMVNFGKQSVPLPSGYRLLLGSMPHPAHGTLAADSAAWLAAT